jgi:branched-chain amino acid transport system substrate-binding protein
MRVPVGSLVVAAPVSLTGRYALMGTLSAAGLRQAVEDAARAGGVVAGGRRLVPEIVVVDDASTRSGVRRALDLLGRADVLVGPYGSDLVAEAARWASERGRLLWNHGASADEVQRLPGLVSVPSPASRYLAAVLEAVADQVPGAPVTVAAGSGAFGRAAVHGAVEAAARLGLGTVSVVAHEDVPDDPDADVLLAAGSFHDDVALVARLRRRPRVLAAVAAGLDEFATQAQAEGVLAPAQWEEGVRFHPDTGPRPADVLRALRARVTPFLAARPGPGRIDYPVAQSYAAALVALRCIADAGTIEDSALDAAARRLRCTTFFGRFGLDPDGRQADHSVVVTQWRGGSRWLVRPPPDGITGGGPPR